jgi:hypothetical protein
VAKDPEKGLSGIRVPHEVIPPSTPSGAMSRDSRPGNRPLPAILALLFLSALLPGLSSAWVYPEHRDIAVQAVQSLDPEQRAVLDRLWAEARSGHERRLCGQAAEAGQGRKPSCIDWAAWPAIAADHSCSGDNMVRIVLESDWILEVADISASLKEHLAKSRTRSERINALRGSDNRLQRADPDYAARAGANNVHFLPARRSVDVDGVAYLLGALQEGAELNALGAYAWYHLSALEQASRLARGGLGPEQRSAVALSALADEAFALHFLEDTYSAGHVAGTWGNASQRKGTHDYYNEHGLEAMRWNAGSIVLMGDAYMRPEDAARGAEAVRTSLGQVLDAAVGRGLAGDLSIEAPATSGPDPFDVCQTMTNPARSAPSGIRPLFTEVIKEVPMPGLGPGPGSLPRFRAELGPFAGLSMAASSRGVDGGFGTTQTTPGAIFSLDAALRLGFGLEGVLNESGDGLIFLDLGIRGDTASTMKITDQPEIGQFGSISAAIPARNAWTVRLRMPFWLIPGDLLLALPVLAFSPGTYTHMAVLAVNGGLIPWQSGIATPIGRFQFVLGREVGVSFYGHMGEDRLVIPPEVPGGSATLIDYRSTSYEFPILEYRPFRSYSLNQSSGLMVQLFGGFEVPRFRSVVLPQDAPEPSLKTIGFGGLRIVFDWRYYP